MNRKALALGLALAVLLPAAAFAQVAPVRVGGSIKEPIKITHVPPVYPEIAQAARIQGVVILEILIGEDGAVQEAKILRPAPMLDQAALEAVLRWKYTPTLLNGQPVPVVMTVTVTFTLSDASQAAQSAAPKAAPDAPQTVRFMTASGVEMEPVRVGGDIKEPKKTKHVSPAYTNHDVQGTVILEAIIDTDGKVKNVKALRSVPGLDESAIAAVSQWEYTPTLVNGVAVPVIMTVTVTFSVR
jgi:TonB family protein